MTSTPNPAISPLALIADDMRAVDRVIAQRLTTSVPLIGQISHYIIAAGGKRLRPALLLLVCGDRTALRKRPDKGLLAGLWEFPNDTEREPPEGGEPCGEAVHVFTHVEWHMTGYLVRCGAETPGCVWCTRAERLALRCQAGMRTTGLIVTPRALSSNAWPMSASS